MKVEKLFDGVFKIDGKLATENLAPGKKVYGEKLVREGAKEYRLWEPSRSKLGAAIARGLKELAVRPGATVLYLGAANGTTASHVSDIVGKKGTVFAVEFSAVSMRDLIRVCEDRQNLLPLLNDARMPQDYRDAVGGKVDVVFEDVADKSQVEILIRNCETFLKDGGTAMIAVKARCMDSAQAPEKIFRRVERQLAENGFEIVQKIDLAPFEMDHEFLVLKKKAN